MKKYLLSALALPLLFACSSEDYLDQKATDNDQFAGIEKVDATFSMADSPKMRMDYGSWDPQEKDLWGFAWLGDGTVITNTNGYANQNHNLIQTSGIFKPQTSIYVGDYYLYRPYDETVVSPEAIHFKSLENQPLAEGISSDGDAWKALAKTAINIGDKFTNVTKTGTTDAAGTTWDKAGTEQHYKINGAFFSNQTGLDLKYTKNNPTFTADQAVSGATDISYTITAGTEVGAANIYDGTVQLVGATQSFTYAPKEEPNASTHDGKFWADKSDLNNNGIAASTAKNAFDFSAGTDIITLTAADEDGIKTEGRTDGWFWFNSLPLPNASAATTTAVNTVLNTSYGVVTINSTIGDCAYVLDRYNATSASVEWIKLASADNASTNPKKWDVAAASHNTFVNQYGNHRGKYALTVDFSTGVMNGMHIKNDAHLQKLLKYYIASGKTESPVVLNLDGASATDKTFKLSKISIALLQTINETTTKVTVKACTEHNNPVKIIVTQEGQEALGLADKTEVPRLNRVFKSATDVYLSSEYNWTWAGGTNGTTSLSTGSGVSKIINEGTLKVTATNVEMSGTTTLENAAGATMNITKVTTVKDALTNLGTINVKENAELRAYNAEIKNDATGLEKGKYGVINNSGVVGVSEGTTGTFNNYGLIDMTDPNAITLLTSNEKNENSDPNGPFKSAFTAGSNMMGTVKLPNNNPTALVSVSNKAETGFIKYNWDEKTYATPEGNVKYNTIVVDDDITFGANAPEIQFIEFNGKRTQVVNPETHNYLAKLRGIIVNDGASIIIEKTNIINCIDGVFLGTGATIYRGGKLQVGGTDITTTAENNYFGDWKLEQIVKF